MTFRVILIFVLFTSALSAEAQKMTITFAPTPDGGGNIYEIDISSASILPEWNVATDEPPLSVESALAIARKELSSNAPESPMKLNSIRLSSATVVERVVVWYYSMSFINDAKYRRDGFLEKSITILMDGSVIKPRKISKDEYAQWFN